MNFCENCGKKIINNNDRFCTGCGTTLNIIDGSSAKVENNGFKISSIVLGIIGIVGSITIILSPICVIISLIGLILGIVASKKVKNISGIILSSIGLLLSISVLALLFLFVNFIIDIVDDNDYDWNYNEEYDFDDDDDNIYEYFEHNDKYY